MSAPSVLPITTIQPSFLNVIDDVRRGLIPSDTFWISCYKTGYPSIHDKIRVALDDFDRDVVRFHSVDTTAQINSQRRSDADVYDIDCSALDIKATPILYPSYEYKDPEHSHPQRPHRISAFDVSLDGTQIALGFHDGSVHIYPADTQLFSTSSAPMKRVSKPHLSSVSSLRFFPSSRVLLTAGADFSLTVLPADPLPQEGSANSIREFKINSIRTLRGHTRVVTSCDIIARGRNILSCSKDGTFRLWDVSSGSQIAAIAAGMGNYVPIASMSAGQKTSGLDGTSDSRESKVDDKEVDTHDKVVFCGLHDGSFEVFDLRSKRMVQRVEVTAGQRSVLTAIDYSHSHQLLAVGSSAGIMTIYDTRSLLSPLATWTRNSASVEYVTITSDVAALPHVQRESANPAVVVATEDGLPYVAQVAPQGVKIMGELVGNDCDPVRVVKSARGTIWAAGDDGIVRKY